MSKRTREAKKLAKEQGANAPAPVVELPPTPEVPETAPGAKPLTQRKSAEQIAKEVQSLLTELRGETSANAKKRIRRMLRTRGHFGGLGIVASRANKAEAGEDSDDNVVA